MSRIILGLNHFFHDSSACVMKDGVLLAAVEEERMNREKHTRRFPANAARECLRVAGLEPRDVDHVALGVRPGQDAHRMLAHAVLHAKAGGGALLRYEAARAMRRQRALTAWLVDTWGLRHLPRVHYVPHHLAHVGGSYFASPYENAALLAIDGSGEWATTFLGQAKGGRVERFHQSYFPMSLGSFYEAATEFCGFRPNYDEGKTMGLAPFGDPARFAKLVGSWVQVDDDGGVHVDLRWFDYPRGGERRCAEPLTRALGPARRRDEPIEAHHRDAAAAFQRVLEERVLQLCKVLRRRSNARHLVLAGGVALNSVMNGRILRESGFDDLYVMAGAGDNGTSIGAAYWVEHAVLGGPHRSVHDDPFVGTGYGNDAIEKSLRGFGLSSEPVPDPIEQVAARIAEGKIVAWFQGRMEFGPRALGARSILANPTLPTMKAVLNERVKHREPFRPFAPSVVLERASEWFATSVADPFMLKVCAVRPEFRERLPAITHVDGSARLQTVRASSHPRYHALLQELGRRTGFPVVLNTSFNVMGQPIVESPDQAIHGFLSSDIDVLAIGDHVLEKASLPSRGPNRQA